MLFSDNLMTRQSNKTAYHAGLFRRLAALVYDGLVVIAILFLASAIAMLFVSLILSPEAITEHQVLIENPFYFAWLMFCWFYYYAWCWRKGGQTLGMRAWRLKLVTVKGDVLTYPNALLRFVSAFFGISNLWVLAPGKRGLHDTLSLTNIVLVDKNS